jgi:hypothetical protein
MTPTFRIRDADKHFEVNRTRDTKCLKWIAVPNKHDSDGFCELMSRPNSMALYGAWQLMVQVASKCNPRWTLVRHGNQPHDAASIARLTRGDVKVFEQAIPVLIEIGWLEVIDGCSNDLRRACDAVALSCGDTAGACDDPATGCPTEKTEITEKTAPVAEGSSSFTGEETKQTELPKPKTTYSPEDLSLAQEIFGLIQVLNPTHKQPNFSVWANDVRLMRERDGRTHVEIIDLFRLANADSFWCQNILSPSKLREHWDKLIIRGRSNGRSKQVSQPLLSDDEFLRGAK